MANDQLRLSAPLQEDSIVDGPGIRMVLWTQGCTHQCINCHNPQTHDATGGTLYSIDQIIEQIESAKLQTGLTLSGGEPFLQSEELLRIAKAAKEKKLNVWAYTGFTFEQLIKHPSQRSLLNHIDTLIDGKYMDELKDYRLVFKGSKNQRIIDVPTSLKEGYVILSSYDDRNQNL